MPLTMTNEKKKWKWKMQQKSKKRQRENVWETKRGKKQLDHIFVAVIGACVSFSPINACACETVSLSECVAAFFHSPLSSICQHSQKEELLNSAFLFVYKNHWLAVSKCNYVLI